LDNLKVEVIVDFVGAEGSGIVNVDGGAGWTGAGAGFAAV
jgi:hypothetical protein